MAASAPLPLLGLAEIEPRLCDEAAEALGISRDRVFAASRLLEDLGADSLALADLFLRAERAFGVPLPDGDRDPICKAVFARRPFRIADLAEVIYLRRGSGLPLRRPPAPVTPAIPPASVPFAQLDGTWPGPDSGVPLFERLGDGPVPSYRRRSDGMRCLLMPAATVEIGSDAPDAPDDERPPHSASLDTFLIDAEPVSTTAYCRFLNSIGDVPPEALLDWFVLDPSDPRGESAMLSRDADGWRPIPGADRWPMVLVSWHGAGAYALWANGRDWRAYRDDEAGGRFLPSEAQWEYAARGAARRRFPWGDDPADAGRLCCGRHVPGESRGAGALPVPAVNDLLGMSPFGLHHMAGTVWQWCRDWYDPDFYRRPEAVGANPANLAPTGNRAERGGSWVGPADLCRSSSRRGRPPEARGRCLGFRCIGDLAGIPRP